MLFFQVFLCDMNMDGASLVLAWSTHLRKCSSSEEFKIASLHWNIYIYTYTWKHIYWFQLFKYIYIYMIWIGSTLLRGVISTLPPNMQAHSHASTCQLRPKLAAQWLGYQWPGTPERFVMMGIWIFQNLDRESQKMNLNLQQVLSNVETSSSSKETTSQVIEGYMFLGIVAVYVLCPLKKTYRLYTALRWLLWGVMHRVSSFL